MRLCCLEVELRGIAIRVELGRGRGKSKEIMGEGRRVGRRSVPMNGVEMGIDDYFLPPLYCFALPLIFFQLLHLNIHTARS